MSVPATVTAECQGDIMCIYDYVATGSSDVGMSTLSTVAVNNETMNILCET